MATVRNCHVCNQSKKQRKSSVICSGCQISFCKEHYQEHRKSIDNDFGDLIQQHNSLRQELYSENNEEIGRMSDLVEKIDDWEKEMIMHIKATAASSKRRVIEIINGEKNELKDKFKLVAAELNTNQSTNDYVEPDIENWQKQIIECKQKLEQLHTWNNDFINVDIKSIDWKDILSVYRRKELRIRPRRIDSKPIPVSTNHKRCVCEECGESFVVDLNCHVSHFKCPDCDNVCFHGDCTVLLANEMTKLVKNVRKGDILATPTGSNATVTYVVKFLRVNTNALMVHFDNGLIITPWHPVRIDGIWKFPNDIEKLSMVECKEVYNFVLDSGHIIFINGVECVTLGHGFKGEVIEHPYYGTDKVLDDLRALVVSNNGLIEVLPNSIIRDSETGLVMGISRCLTTLSWPPHSNLDIFVQ